MKRFVQIPEDVQCDARLSLGARVTYGVVARFAWKAGRRSEEDAPIVLPPLDEIATAVGVSRTALKTYLAELRREGLVFTRRVGNRATAYSIFDSPCQSESDCQERRRQSESDPLASQILTPSRAGASDQGSSRAKEKSEYGETDVSPGATTSVEPAPIPAKAPRLVKVEGRNPGMDALAEETGADPAGGRVGELNAALNGRPGQPGIRDQFWRECVRYVENHPEARALLEDVAAPPRFEQALANAVRRKAALYRAKMPEGTTLSPSALRKWWTDLERMPDRAARPGGVTPAEIRAMGRRDAA